MANIFSLVYSLHAAHSTEVEHLTFLSWQASVTSRLDQAWNPYYRGRLSTVDLLVKIACFE